MHKRTQNIVTLVFVIALLLLFTLPRRYLFRVCRELTTLAAQAEAEVVSGGDATDALLLLLGTYQESSGKLKLFLDHVSVDAVGAAVAVCTPEAAPEDIVAGLHTLNAAVMHLRGIESLSAENLF